MEEYKKYSAVEKNGEVISVTYCLGNEKRVDVVFQSMENGKAYYTVALYERDPLHIDEWYLNEDTEDEGFLTFSIEPFFVQKWLAFKMIEHLWLNGDFKRNEYEQAKKDFEENFWCSEEPSFRGSLELGHVLIDSVNSTLKKEI